MHADVPAHIQDAAFAGHMATVQRLRTALGRAPTRQEAAHALAEAYGDMLVLYAGSGAQAHQIDAINRIAQRASTTMFCKIMVDDCGGFA